MKTGTIEYTVGDKKFTGFLADGSNGKKTAGILVAHEGGGMTDHPKERAKMLAELGYVAFAMDTFGEAITSREQAMAIINRFMGDLPTLRARANAALDIVKEMQAGNVDWRMELYGGAGHSFTNRAIDAMNLPGFKYHEPTDRRSWRAMRDFFDEVLGPVA